MSAMNPVTSVLEFVLKRLWEDRCGGLLFHEAYQAMGAYRGRGRKSGGRVGGFSALEQQAVRRVIPATCPAWRGRGRHRRRASFARSGRPPGKCPKTVNARLLVTAPSHAGSEETVEVSHEALIRNWVGFGPGSTKIASSAVA